MPFPAIVWIILGGTAVAVAAGSSKSSGGVMTVRFPSGTNKFADPKYTLLGGPAYNPSNRVINVQGFDSSSWIGDRVPDAIGYEYLASVPNNAKARVAAMRGKIVSGPRPRDGVAPLVKTSSLVLESFATTLYNTLRSKDGIRSLANALSIPEALLKKQAEKIINIFSTGNPTADQIISSILRSYSDQLVSLFKQVTASLVGEASSSAANAIAGSIGKAVPFLQILAAMGEAAVAEANRRDMENCRTQANTIRRVAEESATLGYPIPWHAVDVFGIDCDRTKSIAGLVPYGSERGGIGNTAIVYDRNFVKTKALTLAQRAALKKWWSMATSLASMPEVREVMETMCIDAYGGQWASDEQIMVIAAPIAVANSVAVDVLARALWDGSKGWRGADPNGYMRALHDTDERDADGYVIRKYVMSDPPINAYQLQFAQLAEDAFRIVKSLPKTRLSAPKSFVHLAPITMP